MFDFSCCVANLSCCEATNAGQVSASSCTSCASRAMAAGRIAGLAQDLRIWGNPRAVQLRELGQGDELLSVKLGADAELQAAQARHAPQAEQVPVHNAPNQ